MPRLRLLFSCLRYFKTASFRFMVGSRYCIVIRRVRWFVFVPYFQSPQSLTAMSHRVQFNRVYHVEIPLDTDLGYLATYFVSTAVTQYTPVWIGYPAILRCPPWGQLGWFTRILAVSRSHFFVAWSPHLTPSQSTIVVRFSLWELDPAYRFLLTRHNCIEDNTFIPGT